MLADERADTLVTSFAAQWLHLRRMRTVAPDVNAFPAFDENLRDAQVRETELFVGSQLRDDRSVVELLTADYTFVNERLARHYGIPGVYGPRFRRVEWGGRPAPRAARAGQHPHRDVPRHPHLAGGAGQVDPREPARHAPAAPAPRRAGAARARRERRARLAAGAARGAPRQPRLLGLPLADGPAGLRPRELRRGGSVARRRRRRGPPSTPPGCCPTGPPSTGCPRCATSCTAAATSSSPPSPRSC